MSFFSALYRLLIGPLELFFEVLFSLANQIFNNPGLSIIFLSLAMNFLVLPLYRRADAMQEEERETNNRLKYWTAHIKKTFKGDERFMILQTYYRQNNYKPTDALKGSVSLLLEIPFFIAAYNFLSGLPLLHGASLGPIVNLGEPDGLLVLGGLAINLLPILMTAINLVSSAIYTKGLPTKSKVQLYVMAGLFLVLLYDSPAGLVFYWTLNNLFSLVKNIFYKLKNPAKVLCILFSTAGAALLVFAIATHPMPTARSQFILCCLLLTLQLPLILYVISRHLPKRDTEPVLTRREHATFWVSGLFMTALTGVMIPTTVIHASPEEFINSVTHTSPLLYILNSALIAAGFFLVWFGVFYMLTSNTGKKWMGYLMCALCVISTADFMFFGKNYGNMSANLVFDVAPVYTHQLLNLAVAAGLAVAVFFVWKKKQELFRFVALTAAVAAIAMSTVNMVQIHTIVSSKTEQLEQAADDMPVIPLSRNGKNVIVLMMDRAVSGYVPFLMNEKPELKEQFAGFTYYPNTISYGGFTNFGSPALFGGYEYTPEELNKRDHEPLLEKQNEALKVMPYLFSNNGFEVTVCDPPYAGYEWIPDLSIYDDLPNVHSYNTMGMFSMEADPRVQAELIDQSRYRNFFCFSLFKVTPTPIQKYLYGNGLYNELNHPINQTIENKFQATGISPLFTRAYSVLLNLRNITAIQDNSRGTFLMLTNDTTHNPSLLKEPEYVPAEVIDNSEYAMTHTERFTLNGKQLRMDTIDQVTHYHANMAALLKLGEWFDYLRSENVFDNTRIIIVSDHGRNLNQFDNIKLSTGQNDDIMLYNPILMVKDFGSTKFSINNDFMTNADTPSIAMDELIQSPINPFTQIPITNEMKFKGPQHIFCSHIWQTTENNGNTFLPGPWYSVHDDIFNLDNWEYLGVK